MCFQTSIESILLLWQKLDFMITILSPAKALKFDKKSIIQDKTNPVFIEEANKIVPYLQKLSANKLKNLMDISDKLAELNKQRFAVWQNEPSDDITRQAIYAFNGEVYNGLKAETMDEDSLYFAQKHIRILSGLYGVLKPFDAIQEYRLEMGSKLKIHRANNLYEFWGDKINKDLQRDLDAMESKTLINLASNEYAKVVNMKKLKARVITPVFKDEKNGEYKVIFVYAKKARGLMARFIADNKITEPEHLKAFDSEGYFYNENMSDENQWVFTR
jgi:cytoplasmic iron level regulating protein YaaA (DUF328/UPF0246 family)